jgi:hypothetical protein
MINEASEDESKATQSSPLSLRKAIRYVRMHCTAADLAYIKDRDRVLTFENQSEQTVSSPIVDQLMTTAKGAAASGRLSYS